MWKKLGCRSKSSLADEVDFLNLCKHNVRIIEDFATSGNLLNQRQCQDLAFKLLKITQNTRELVLHCGASAAHNFRPALGNLYQYLEKAKVLVSTCGNKDWCIAAVFQIQNENAFRDILLDVGLCYNAIYELAKNIREDWSILPEDLRKSSVFLPATVNEVLLDQQDLEKRLEGLANEPSSSKPWVVLRRRALKHCLARYLRAKLKYTSEQSHATTLDICSVILWDKESEPIGTWGNTSYFLGAGSGASGVCSTKWMGIPCAKKDFHPQDTEIFFLKEAGILAHLKHPCIVNFFCCGNGVEKGNRFIAMELMEKSLLDLIEEQKEVYFSLPVVVDMIVQIARGMCYLHGQGVAHRDLKPSNVVVKRLTSAHLEDHFCVKLVDFGMSKTKVEVSKFNTMTNLGIGSTIYRAPEVHPDANLSGKGRVNWFKADVFSFAMTCTHLLSLKVPFKNTLRLMELYNTLIEGQRPELPKDCPRDLIALIKDCWNTNPSLRPSFVEIWTRLESFRHKIFKGFSIFDLNFEKDEMTFITGLEFIKVIMEEHFIVQKSSFFNLEDEIEGGSCDSNEINRNDVVSVIPCTCGRSFEFLSRSSYISGTFTCNICWKFGEEEVYHCEICQFDAHRDCVEIKDKMNVFFHVDPLHLLVRNYHDNNPDAICGFCMESLQGSEWVYNCKKCNFNVHALCTKIPREINRNMVHLHPLTLVQSPLRKNSSCKCCNGNFQGFRYTCTQKRCTFDLHPLCSILSKNILCIFDQSHRLHLKLHEFYPLKGFHCGKCGALGFSRFYECKVCDVNIHLDCVYDIEEEEHDWIEAYEKFMLEFGNKADYDKMDMIMELLDLLFINCQVLETNSSSTSMLRPAMRVQPTIQRPTSREAHNSNAFDDMDLRKKVVVETEERKAKRMATKEARQKAKARLMANLDMKLESLETILHDLQSSVVDAEVLATTHEKLKKIQNFVQELISSKIRPIPCIGLIQNSLQSGLLTTLPADMWGVRLVLLCEEPGHEHIVRLENRTSGCRIDDMVGEQVEKLQLLMASGLEVLKLALTQVTCITTLDSVTLPILDEKPWDLRAIGLEKDDVVQTKRASKDKENIELQKMAQDAAAESLLGYLEDNEINIFETFGLLRIRYTTIELGNCPRYTKGKVAWLCSEHQRRGLEAGILEPYPFRIYHNLEYDKQRQFL